MSRLIRPHGPSAVRAKRIDNGNGLVVESRTIGTEMAFNLETDNLSRTGFLLNSANYQRVPFQVNTILEMRVDTKGSVFREPVTCLGKIVRLTTDEHDEAGERVKRYGVQIVQMEGKDSETWERLVNGLERFSGDAERVDRLLASAVTTDN